MGDQVDVANPNPSEKLVGLGSHLFGVQELPFFAVFGNHELGKVEPRRPFRQPVLDNQIVPAPFHIKEVSENSGKGSIGGAGSVLFRSSERVRDHSKSLAHGSPPLVAEDGLPRLEIPPKLPSEHAVMRKNIRGQVVERGENARLPLVRAAEPREPEKRNLVARGILARTVPLRDLGPADVPDLSDQAAYNLALHEAGKSLPHGLVVAENRARHVVPVVLMVLPVEREHPILIVEHGELVRDTRDFRQQGVEDAGVERPLHLIQERNEQLDLLFCERHRRLLSGKCPQTKKGNNVKKLHKL